MGKRMLLLISLWLVVGLLSLGCEDDPTGACVTDLGLPGTPPTCADGRTKRECDYGFNTFYEGKTCKELGFENGSYNISILDSLAAVADSCGCRPRPFSARGIFRP